MTNSQNWRTSRDKQFFTTGAFVSPVQIGDKWYWIVDEFESDTFYDGDCLDGIQPCADSEAGLVETETEEDSDDLNG